MTAKGVTIVAGTLTTLRHEIDTLALYLRALEQEERCLQQAILHAKAQINTKTAQCITLWRQEHC